MGTLPEVEPNDGAADADRGLVVTVSTIKTSVADAKTFLDRNLSAGVDHMFVFMDAKNLRLREMLDAHPHVTVVRTNPRYWNGARPERVSDRLRINANLANVVLATVPSVRWLFSIDSDEALSFDRSALLARSETVIRFPVWEAAAQATWAGEPTLFKRTPTRAELETLVALRAIEEPFAEHYFRGHPDGKAGTQPDLGVRFKVHAVVSHRGAHLRMAEPQEMHLLHYESWCLADFVDRWRDYAPQKAKLRTHRDSRKRLGIALHTLYHLPHVEEAERDRLVRQLFDARVADDLELLGSLGMLATPPPRQNRPRPLPAEHREQFRWIVEALHPADKSVFNDGGSSEDMVRTLAEAADRIPAEGEFAAQRLRKTLEEFASRIGVTLPAPADPPPSMGPVAGSTPTGVSGPPPPVAP
jgi:hypothetical protein